MPYSHNVYSDSDDDGYGGSSDDGYGHGGCPGCGLQLGPRRRRSRLQRVQ